ncbi:MAG: hypothetical protein WBL23_16260 [Salinisphaera sp.]|uniref:hypothetical protein n=1 Tax=Salinisphaera sp. TaxID=1914330 RepID=UPI003C7A28B0
MIYIKFRVVAKTYGLRHALMALVPSDRGMGLKRRIKFKEMAMYRQKSAGIYYWGILVLVGLTLNVLFSPQAAAVPSFSRQTGQACAACHTSYPGLTPYGRQFKLSGYQISTLKQVKSKASDSSPGMSINRIPNLSVILQAGEAYLNKRVSGTQNPNADFPKELGFYYAGKVAPHLGTFLQATYDSGGSFGIDMSDMRYARYAKLFSKSTLWGLDINNGPTFEDPWNSTPGYGWPYVENDAAVGPTIGPFISSEAVQTNVIGAGAYQYWNNLLYAYVGVYQAAPQGNTPANWNNGATISGAAPYYRIAFTPTPNLEIGSFGLFTDFHPHNVNSGKDRYTDIGLDTQYQLYPNQNNILTFHASYIYEKHSNISRTMGSGYTGSDSLTTNFYNLDGNWYYKHRYGLGLGFFYTQGDSSPYYQDVYGNSSDGFKTNTRPNTNGEIAQLDYFPYQNVRLSMQYIAYNKFNGSSSNYNGQGRSASDNNTWLLNALFGF